MPKYINYRQIYAGRMIFRQYKPCCSFAGCHPYLFNLKTFLGERFTFLNIPVCFMTYHIPDMPAPALDPFTIIKTSCRDQVSHISELTRGAPSEKHCKS